MGFRNISIFNQAMLGKQCWRLLTEPNSLCARVLKGRYYPDGDFWTAKCPRSSSYTRRSLMYGKRLVQKGLQWRVGDGNTIHTYEDNWIPDIAPTTLQHISSRSGNDMVSSLIIKGENKWNEETVRNIFLEDISEKILSLPLSTEGCPDFVSWPHTKDGVYTVRSAYNFLRTLNFWRDKSANGKWAFSDQKSMEKSWRKLRQMHCPNKM